MDWRGRFVSFAKDDLPAAERQGIEKENIMKKTLIRLLTISCLLAASSLNSVAQEKNPRPDESRPQKTVQIEVKVPTDGTFKILPPMVPNFAFGPSHQRSGILRLFEVIELIVLEARLGKRCSGRRTIS